MEAVVLGFTEATVRRRVSRKRGLITENPIDIVETGCFSL